MRRRLMHFLWTSGLVGFLAIAMLIWQYPALILEYDWYRFQSAAEADDSKYALALSRHGEPTRLAVLDCLQSTKPGYQASAGKAIKALVRIWGSDSSTATEFVARLSASYAGFPPEGRQTVRELLPELLRLPGNAAEDVWKSTDADLRREIVAVVRKSMPERFDLAVARLNDPEPEIRRAALLIVGPGSDTGMDALDTERIIAYLHDPDDVVREICSSCLKTRGLSESDVRMARRLTHPEPRERLELLLDLRRERGTDDLNRWLERLSRDSNAAVRLGSARVAAERRVVDFGDRLREMSRDDPDGTVRRQAEFYLSAMKENR